MKRILVATSNPGKIRDLVGAAIAHNVQIEMLPGFALLPSVSGGRRHLRSQCPQESRAL